MTKTSWDNSAQWYDEYLEGQQTYQKTVILPNLLRFVAPKIGERILDLACGQGYFSRELAKKGAEVVGVDAASELIKLAQEKSPSLTFKTAPAHATGLSAMHFDQATLISAIQNIHNPEDTFRECRRVLKPKGKLHIVMNHPAFRVPKNSDWGFDPGSGIQYRRVDKYLSEGKAAIQMHPGKDAKLVTYTYHRPLQTYFKWLAKSGFAVTGMEEWISDRKSDSGPRASAENRARQEIPLFMYLQATKI